MNDVLTKAEEKLFIQVESNKELFLPICCALKLAGYDIAIIAEIMRVVQAQPTVPERFSIINNRYLACSSGTLYDLHTCQELPEAPAEPKKIAITFWI